jgi:hypothetical protein
MVDINKKNAYAVAKLDPEDESPMTIDVSGNTLYPCWILSRH